MKTTVVTIRWEDGTSSSEGGEYRPTGGSLSDRAFFAGWREKSRTPEALSAYSFSAQALAPLEIEASGPDEREAIQAIDAFFSSSDDSSTQNSDRS